MLETIWPTLPPSFEGCSKLRTPEIYWKVQLESSLFNGLSLRVHLQTRKYQPIDTSRWYHGIICWSRKWFTFLVMEHVREGFTHGAMFQVLCRSIVTSSLCFAESLCCFSSCHQLRWLTLGEAWKSIYGHVTWVSTCESRMEKRHPWMRQQNQERKH